MFRGANSRAAFSLLPVFPAAGGSALSLSPGRREAACSGYGTFFGLGSLAVGHFVLTLFGLSLPVIQLGGGLLICRTALQWLSDSDSSVGHAQGKDVNPLHKIALESQVFYPITFPISIGPGSVSVILTLMASVSMKDGWAKGLLSYAIIALVIVLMCLILYLFLSQGERIIRKIGTSGSIVINKMVAFFTFCVGVQIVVTGIAKLFHLHL